uniref:Odorant binding protein n=1 Tax=Heliothis virescens TaxID=7102 RepID=A0A2A4J0A8_HELVI
MLWSTRPWGGMWKSFRNSLLAVTILISQDTNYIFFTVHFQCEKLTCTFREYNLLDDEVINKERATAFFDNYTRENATFTAAVEHIKSECLGSVELKPQGIYLDCPVYDVLYCVYRNVVKHAAPSQWSTTPECTAERAFAAACPICPDECFKPEVPAGSCNAC